MSEKRKARISYETARAVVEGWQKDGLFGALCTNAELPFFPFNFRIRVFLAKTNTPANEAMWNDFPNKATRLIQELGFFERLQPLANIRSLHRYHSKKLQALSLARDVQSARNKIGKAWGTMKGPRTRALR